MRTVVSKKGQVVIPKEARDRLGLSAGTPLRVEVEGKRLILEPWRDLPEEAFVRAGRRITKPILREAKGESDKSERLLKDLGVGLG